MTCAKDDIKQFMNEKLSKIISYNPASLIEYLIMITPKCDKETQLEVYLQSRLEEFLGDNTAGFIKDLLKYLKSKNISIQTLSYATPAAPKLITTPKPIQTAITTTKKLKPATTNVRSVKAEQPRSSRYTDYHKDRRENSDFNRNKPNYEPKHESRYPNNRQLKENINYKDNYNSNINYNKDSQNRLNYKQDNNVHKFNNNPTNHNNRVSSTVIFTRLPLFLNNKMKLYNLLKEIGNIIKIETNLNKSLAFIRFKNMKDAEVVYNEGLEKVPILKASDVNINYARNLICKEMPMYLAIEKEAKTQELKVKEKATLAKIAAIFSKIGKYREILNKAEQNKDTEKGKELIKQINVNVLKLKNDMDESKMDLETLRKEKESLEK